MQTAATPTKTTLKIEVTSPDGKKKLIGWVYKHKNPVLDFVLGNIHKQFMDFNIRRHNKKYPLGE